MPWALNPHFGGNMVKDKFGFADNGKINLKQVQTKRDKICLCGEGLYTLQPQFKFPPSIDYYEARLGLFLLLVQTHLNLFEAMT